VGLLPRGLHDLAERRPRRPAQEVENDRLLRPLLRFGGGLGCLPGLRLLLSRTFGCAFGLLCRFSLLAAALGFRVFFERLARFFAGTFSGSVCAVCVASAPETAAIVDSVMLRFS
jgi:hypothetical protein